MTKMILRGLAIFLCLCGSVTALLDDEQLLRSFSEVFAVKDILVDTRSRVVQRALVQLDHLGVSRDITSCGNMTDETLADVLMRAALGNIILGMKDPDDWSVIVADTSSGRLVRQRSFSASRFAVIESLLLIAIVALGRSVWLKIQV